MYERMAAHYGPTHWWPGDTAFEIAVGAILTQNTAWTNVERAIANLKRMRLLSPRKIVGSPDKTLYAALKPSGYFRIKTDRLRSFCGYLLDRYCGSMRRMAKRPLAELRRELLAVDGIGPETADDILLYACGKIVFVVDAYTRRILSRHGLVGSDATYEHLQALFERHLDPDLHTFKEYHGLIVWTGKDFCRKRPRCEGCPLAPMLKQGQPIR
jgi:endonuclease-3 related protein